MSPLVVRAETRLEHRAGPFRIWRSHPGRSLPRSRDTGLGALGCVDHAHLLPGLRVPMHTHRDDEILSYLRVGSLTHTDTLGEQLLLDARHLLLMNAGSGLAHEEHIPEGAAPVGMLQIFVRPVASGLPPALQFRPLAAAESINQWRLVAGPDSSGAPFHFRNAVRFHDVTLRHATLPLPPATTREARWLYVFDGRISLGSDLTLSTGDAAILTPEDDSTVRAEADARLVCFHCDLTASFTRNGSLSG